MRDYNARTEPLRCLAQDNGGAPQRWYVGRDYSARIRTLETERRPSGYASLVNRFVSTLQHILSRKRMLIHNHLGTLASWRGRVQSQQFGFCLVCYQ